MSKDLEFKKLDFSKIIGKTIFLDVDGTLVPDKIKEIPGEVIDKVFLLNQNNKVYLCSNGSLEVARDISNIIGCEYVECKKPMVGPFKKVLNKNSDILVIGDKYLTDGLLSRFLGAEFIKVRRLIGEADSFFIKLTYFLDNLAFKLLPKLELMRPWQWVKNLLVFSPIFFALKAFDFEAVTNVFYAFFAFCFSSSLAYVFNDLKDVEQDKLHPLKRNRPVASGLVSKKEAFYLVFFILFLISIFVYLVPVVLPVIAIYLILNFAYSNKLKKVAVLDIVVISIFYILRVVVGGLAAEVPISPWIITCVFFGSLFVVVGKRKSEQAQEKKRIVLEQYSEKALDLMLSISAGLSVISYLMWSITDHSQYLTYSTVFVIFALFKILNVIYTNPDKGESPELLVFKDVSILTSFIMWLLYVFVIFYII